MSHHRSKYLVEIVTIGLCLMRIFGVKDRAFQATAHLWVGFLIGMGISYWRSDYFTSLFWLAFAAVMSVVEVLVFVTQTLRGSS